MRARHRRGERFSVSERLLALVLLSLVLSLGTIGLVKVGLEAALPGPSWLQKLVRYQEAPSADCTASYTYDLGRVSRRYLLLVTLVVGVAVRRWVPWTALTRRAFPSTAKRSSNLRFGLAVAFGLLAAYLVLLVGSGLAIWSPDPPGYLARKTVEYLILAALVGLLEEVVFRAVVFRAMLRDWGPCRAVVASSALFGALHCISGSERVAPGWHPGVGLHLLRVYFTDSSGSILPDLRLSVGLSLLGLLLAYLYLRTGSLWAPIGLHSGMVFASKIMKKFVGRSESLPEWLLGDEQFLVSGVLCWLVIVAALVAVVRLAPRGSLYHRLARSASR